MLAQVQKDTIRGHHRSNQMTVLRNDITGNSDSLLWQQFREGSEEAFLKIYNANVRLLFNYGMKFDSDRDLIQDCLQDFFLYLREKRTCLGATTSIKFYLMRSFKRRLFVYLNKEAKQNKRTADITEFHLELTDCNIEELIDGEDLGEAVSKMNKALKQLSVKEREAIFYYYYEDLSYQEIADLLEFAHVSSARRIIYIALDNLRVKMRKHIMMRSR